MSAPAPTARSVGVDALLYIPGRAIPAVVQVLTVSLLTWFFTPEDVGRYDLAFRFALLLCTGTVLWLNMAVLRFYPAHVQQGTLDPFFSVLAWLRYGLMALGTVAGLICWRFGPESLFGEYRALLLPATLVFLGYTVYESGLAVLRARRMPLRYSIAATVNALIRLPLAFALFKWGGLDVSGMLWALTVTYLGAHAAFLWSQTGRPHLRYGDREREIMRAILAYGLPVAGAQLLNFFLGNLDRYFLQTMRGSHEVGLYAVATNFVEQPMMLIFQTFTLAVFPSVASAWEQHGRETAESLIRGATRIFLLACLPLGVYLAAFAKPICAAFAHGGSVDAYPAAPWIAAAAFLYGLHYMANFGLHLAHRTGQLLGATIAALALNAALNFYLVPESGFVGAGIARTIANAAFVLALAYLSNRHVRWQFPWLSLVKLSIASGLAAAAGLAALDACADLNKRVALVIASGAFGIVAAAAVLLSGELNVRNLVFRKR